MERTLIGRAIAKEANRHLAFPIVFGGKSRASCQRKAAAYDAVRPEHALIYVCDVHRAAFSTACTCFTAQQFGNHFPQTDSFGDAMPMPAMVTGDKVVVCRSEEHTSELQSR